ncbi:hypothetical protein THIX_60777 [Thiomonas sp. X19]|nr:hypothetical protein THIX_30834 [Thiomonas sp. X19]SCC94719.1 hypothetical protein THIX_60777 [Thiomonas sp. X19]
MYRHPARVLVFLAFKAQPRTMLFGSRAEPEQVGTGAQTQKPASEARAVSRIVTTAPYPALLS